MQQQKRPSSQQRTDGQTDFQSRISVDVVVTESHGMMYSGFHEQQFRRRVDAALKQVKTILDINRNPRYAEDQDHSYDDKYALAELLVNTGIAAQVNIFERMDLTQEKIRSLRDIVVKDKRTVTLRFEAEHSCSFLKEEKVQVVTNETAVTVESTRSSLVGERTTTETSKHKITRTVREYHWEVGMTYKVFCYAGSNPADSPIELRSRSSSTTVVTTGSKDAPFEKRFVYDPLQCSLTWFLKMVNPQDDQLECIFKIDRSKGSCRTPRRNEDIRMALEFFGGCQRWSLRCERRFRKNVEGRIWRTHSPANAEPRSKRISLDTVVGKEVFCPVLPVMETPRDVGGSATRQEQPQSLLEIASNEGGELTTTTTGTTGRLLSVDDMNLLMKEQCRSLDAALGSISTSFAPPQLPKLITTAEAKLALILSCTTTLGNAVNEGVDYIAHMLRQQLIAAIGKEVQPEDFDQFMSFHLPKLFREAYAPKPFCFAIRRPNRFPDGMLSIERANSEKLEPIETMVRMIPQEGSAPISIPLSAATTVQMTGARYLHGWIRHVFQSAASSNFRLAARARQFSGFILIIGTMGGADKFLPKDAILLRDKDEVLIPLLVTELPSAKEFKDAISSLSPEQKRFAESFRRMQLESSVLGVCVIQLKPQLEVLLGLPCDSLTKEIQLTQDLMSLFIEYQVPSDLLSYDGDADASARTKVDRVKEHVRSVADVIVARSQGQLERAANQAQMNATSTHADTDAQLLRASAGQQRCSMQLSARSRSGRQHQPMATLSPAAKPRVGKRSATTRSNSSANDDVTADTNVESMRNLDGGMMDPGGRVDFTLIPKQLDAKFEKYDVDNSLRATILKTDKVWERKRQKNLLMRAPTTTYLRKEDIRTEKNKAFDLLDALSRSGSLAIGSAELHVIVAVSHCFENDVMGTVVEDSINPIEKVEKSCLMIASTIQGTEGSNLLSSEDDRSRLRGLFPELLDGEDR